MLLHRSNDKSISEVHPGGSIEVKCPQDTHTVLHMKLRQANESSEHLLNSAATNMVEPRGGKHVYGISNHRIRSLNAEKSLFNLLEQRCCRSLFPRIISRQKTNDYIRIDEWLRHEFDSFFAAKRSSYAIRCICCQDMGFGKRPAAPRSEAMFG